MTVTFTGNLSEDWFQAGNWSNNELPRPCDTVIIPAGTSCALAEEGVATAKMILIESGAVFGNKEGAIMNVDASY